MIHSADIRDSMPCLHPTKGPTQSDGNPLLNPRNHPQKWNNFPLIMNKFEGEYIKLLYW